MDLEENSAVGRMGGLKLHRDNQMTWKLIQLKLLLNVNIWIKSTCSTFNRKTYSHRLINGLYITGVSSSSSKLFPYMLVSQELDTGMAFFKGSRTSSNSLELASSARIWWFEEQAALMEDPTKDNTIHGLNYSKT